MSPTSAPSTTPSPSTEPPAPPVSKSKHARKYKLRVTAGTSYDSSTHVVVPVNATETLHLNSANMCLSLCVRIKHFTGVPASLPASSPYFSHPLHTSDQYSISFSFIPKVDIPGGDLVFGNDFDRPIRDRLPAGFNHALRIVKWIIDPGLEGDPYADKPYLYGPALSSWNILRIGNDILGPKNVEQEKEKEQNTSNTSNNNDSSSMARNPDQLDPKTWRIPNADSFHSLIVEEGGSDPDPDPSPTSSSPSPSGSDLRSYHSIPPTPSARKKHFLTPSNLTSFTFEAGRLYQSDFGNPYLDFNDFSLQLPGFSINVIKYVDEKTHELRYVLKNRASGDVYAVVVFGLLYGEDGLVAEDEVERKEGKGGENSNTDANGDVGPTARSAGSSEPGDFGKETPPNADDVD